MYPCLFKILKRINVYFGWHFEISCFHLFVKKTVCNTNYLRRKTVIQLICKKEKGFVVVGVI